MIFGGHGEAHRVNFFHCQGFEIANHACFEFGGHLGGACGVGIHHAHQFHTCHFRPHPHVVAPEFSDADHGNAYGFFSHDFLLAADFRAPPSSPLTMRWGAKASIAMPAASAARIMASRSNSKSWTASMASAVARAL